MDEREKFNETSLSEKTEFENPVNNLHDKTEYVIHIRNLKQGLNHELDSKKVHREIKVNQNVWLRPYIVLNIKL